MPPLFAPLVFLSITLSSQLVLMPDRDAMNLTKVTARAFQHSTSNCLHMSSDRSGGFTATVLLGEEKKPANLIVDTGSPFLLIDQVMATTTQIAAAVEMALGRFAEVAKHFAKCAGTGPSTNAVGHSDGGEAGGNDIEERVQPRQRFERHEVNAQTQRAARLEALGLPAGPLSFAVLGALCTCVRVSECSPGQVKHHSRPCRNPQAWGDGFSICLTSSGGTLAFGAISATVPATTDWKVSVQGMSVNGQPTGIHTSATVDSGTTLITAPVADLDVLFTLLCSNWANCDGETSVDFVKSVRTHCDSSLPDLTIQLPGATLTLPGSAYVYMYGSKCDVAFDTFDVWILGQPVFFEYAVSFNAQAHTVGFNQGGCPSCGSSLEQEQAAPHLQSARRVRHLDGPPRSPTLSSKRIQLGEAEKTSFGLVRLAELLDVRQRFKQ